jgi:hypothetical protein
MTKQDCPVRLTVSTENITSHATNILPSTDTFKNILAVLKYVPIDKSLKLSYK